MKVAILKISNCFEIDINKMKQYISEKKRGRIDKFLRREDKLRGLYGELLIRKMIIDKLKINNKDIHFEINKYGKPYLKDKENVYFNISHSGEYIVCCLDSKPVGIDIEIIKPMEIEGISKNFFTPSEQKYIFENSTLINSEESINKFYDIWTLKESFIKCVGKGLHIPLNEFYIVFDKQGKINIETNETTNRYFFKQIPVDIKYKMSICSQDNIKIDELDYIIEEDFVSKF